MSYQPERVLPAIQRDLRAFVGATACFVDVSGAPAPSITPQFRELIAKAPLVLADLSNAGANWRVHYALFACAGATPAAQRELAAQQGFVIDLARLYADLVE